MPLFRLTSGQATIELVGVLPLLLLAALLCVQGLLLALSAIYAEAAATSAARSARQGPAVPAAQLPVPKAWRRSARVRLSAERADVSLRVPSVLPSVQLPRVSSSVSTGARAKGSS